MKIPPASDLLPLAPQLFVTLLAMVVLLLEALRPRTSNRALANVSLLGLAVAFLLQVWHWPVGGSVKTLLNGMAAADLYTACFNVILIAGTFLGILLSVDYLEQEGSGHGEYYALLLFTTAGGMIMASSMNLIAIFLGLEILSVSLYILAGYQRERLVSEEAALKYFLLGAFASAFFLYGMALMYGASGSLDLAEIRDRISIQGDTSRNYLLLGGVSLMLVGFGFKVAVVPFHIWTPDVYEGAPTAVTAFMSVVAKAAGFAAFVRVLAFAFPTGAQITIQVSAVLASVATLTMIVGNVVAIAQRNIKRLLAYSSIAHAGYMLVGVVAALRDPAGEGIPSVLFYALVYTFSNLGAFAVVLALRKRGEELLTLDEMSGLGVRYPALGLLMALFMLSLAGMPPTAGFLGKLYVFRALLNLSDTVAMPWLVIVAVLTSVVSFYYYVRVVTNMFMRPAELKEDETEYAGRGPLGFSLVATAVGTILLGILPSYFLSVAQQVGAAIQQAQGGG